MKNVTLECDNCGKVRECLPLKVSEDETIYLCKKECKPEWKKNVKRYNSCMEVLG